MPEHLRIAREVPVTDRHRRQDRRPRFRPADPRQFGRDLAAKLEASKAGLAEDLGGYDERRLLKIVLRPGESSPDLEAIQGIEVVSQEGRSLVLAFAAGDGMAEFESRLATLIRDGAVTRAQLLYAIADFSHWTPGDRTGKALHESGFPDHRPFVLDVELWPQERVDRRAQMVDAFRNWLNAEGIAHLDTIAQPSLVMVRVRCNREQADRLRAHRDVRTVDLPPRFGIELRMLLADVGEIPAPVPPLDGAPAIAVLDSGLTAGHPLLRPAVGDAQGFVPPERLVGDCLPQGHGTFVSGLALYGDVAASIRAGRFVPMLRLLSAKVFKDDGTDHAEFVERAVEEAVEYFRREYGCRVFNLSYGDLNKVYDGRHLRGLAYTLDRLSRALNVLFVTSTGNRPLMELPELVREQYPGYLFQAAGRLLDPGTALNALTVGGLAEHDVTTDAQRYPNHLEDVPLARSGQPSPFTRCGPSVNDAIKPDFVEHAGNVAVDRHRRLHTRGLGVLSFNSGFANERPFCAAAGTSYAAPVVAHKAARLLTELPDASPNLVRALLGAHAGWPPSSVGLLNPNDSADGRGLLLRAVGYGQVDDQALYQSLDRRVTLITEERIETDCHHFFEVPVPASWWEGARRERSVSVALAYTPEVRTTRLEYRATKIRFTFVSADNLDDVSAAFRRNRDDGMPERVSNRWISSEQRNSGTLQVSRWDFKGRIKASRLFVVVTRQDLPWCTVADQPESYALAIVLDDRQHAEVNLYNEVRAMLQGRARVRLQI
ncbi:MAG: S8 family peptidase [Vicinamibacterales bacterium]